jgi:hypothetical protein
MVVEESSTIKKERLDIPKPYETFNGSVGYSYAMIFPCIVVMRERKST